MAIGIGYGIIYGPYEAAYKDPLKFFSKTENVVYGSFSDFAWSLAVAWVIYACETNNAGTKFGLESMLTLKTFLSTYLCYIQRSLRGKSEDFCYWAK